MAKITLAAVSMNAELDKDHNLKKYLRFIDEASGLGASLIVFPEMSLQGYLYSANHEFTAEELRYHHENAEAAPGESTEILASKAAEKNIYIIYGFCEKVETSFIQLLYNSAALVGPEGLIGVYRKVHLAGNERDIFRPGDSWNVFETNLGRIGIFICYDLLFPESVRELTLGGAEILVSPTAWPGEGGWFTHAWELLTRTRALENVRWLVASGMVGVSKQQRYLGNSRIVNPQGKVIAETSEEGLITATVSVQEELKRLQNETIFSPLRWRVPGSYENISKDLYS